MVSIQPFSFQFCTAFRERKQLAEKTNEIIEVINSADLENLPTEIESINQDIEDLENSTVENSTDIETLNDTTVKKTGDESISGNKTFTDTIYADDVNTKALTVHSENQMLSGTVILSPNSQGGNILLKDIQNRFISIIQSHDNNNNCYLRVYPNTYHPVDSNNDPVAPPNDVIMTSGLIGVDPRITEKATIDYVDDEIDDVKNPVWVLCNDISTIYERIDSLTSDRGCGKFIKDVKIVFNLKYQYTYDGTTILDTFYTTIMNFKKNDIFRFDNNILNVINGKNLITSISTYNFTKVYIDFSFYKLLTQTTHYRPYTECVNDRNETHSYYNDLLCSRQNEDLDYEQDSFINIYVTE